jgi:uncharacterized repeat protein (TIGR01451 family)
MNLGLLTLAMTIGQPMGLPAVPPPALPPSPFLFVKVTAPDSGKVTWYPGTNSATQTSTAVGLRPGYPYRLQISGMPSHKGEVLFPSIEVRGSLVPRPGLDVTKHPVPVVLTERDIEKAIQGQMVTKVYYLEDPEKAIAATGSPDEPLELTVENEAKAIKDARTRGRMMLILRLGSRAFKAEELTYENVPGTILFAGSKEMPMPAIPPCLPFMGVMVHDPIIGMRGASEECLADGGDVKTRVGVGADGVMYGLDPTDTAMQFTTPRGGTKVVPSNRVCICIPRFACARLETGVVDHHVMRLAGIDQVMRPVRGFDNLQKPQETKTVDQVAGLIGANRASGIEMVTGPATVQQWSGVLSGLSSVKGVAVAAQVEAPEQITAFPNCSLMLQKRVEPPFPEKIGDEVTFTLTYRNSTTETMTSVVVADSLTTRLEYIEGSAKASRAVTFAAMPNEANSMTLRWLIDGELKPGESGTITFKAKVK